MRDVRNKLDAAIGLFTLVIVSGAVWLIFKITWLLLKPAIRETMQRMGL